MGFDRNDGICNVAAEPRFATSGGKRGMDPGSRREDGPWMLSRSPVFFQSNTGPATCEYTAMKWHTLPAMTKPCQMACA